MHLYRKFLHILTDQIQRRLEPRAVQPDLTRPADFQHPIILATDNLDLTAGRGNEQELPYVREGLAGEAFFAALGVPRCGFTDTADLNTLQATH